MDHSPHFFRQKFSHNFWNRRWHSLNATSIFEVKKINRNTRTYKVLRLHNMGATGVGVEFFSQIKNETL